MFSDDTEHTLFVAQALLKHADSPERFARRLGWSQGIARPGKQMNVVETMALDARHKIVLVKIGETTKAALLGPNSCQFLNEEIQLTEFEEEETAQTTPSLFAPRPEVLNWQQAIRTLRDKIYNIPEPAAPPAFKDQLEEELADHRRDGEARSA